MYVQVHGTAPFLLFNDQLSKKYTSRHSSALPATDIVIRDTFHHASYVYAVSELSNRGEVCRKFNQFS